MVSQNAAAYGEIKGKRRSRTKPKHDRSSDKKNSSPKPNLVEMVSETAAGASGEKKNTSSMPNLIYDRSDMVPKEEDLESDATLMALYERWCCYHKINRTPDEMKERFVHFKERVFRLYEFNNNHTSLPYVLFRFSDLTPEERRRGRTPICLPCPPVSVEERRHLSQMHRLGMCRPKKKLG